MDNRLINFLEDAGFNMVDFPKSSIEPLQILAKEGNSLKIVGHIDDIFSRGDVVPKPQINNDVDIPNELLGNNNKIIKAKTSFKFLEKIFSFLGIKGGGLDTSLKNEGNLRYSFNDPELDEVVLIKLDQYLNDAKIVTGSPTYLDKLKDGQLYVITQVLKSSGLSIVSDKAMEGEVELALPQVNNVIAADIDLHASTDKNLVVKYKGSGKLVFAVQAVRIIPYKESYRIKNVSGKPVRKDGDSAEYFTGEELLSL